MTKENLVEKLKDVQESKKKVENTFYQLVGQESLLLHLIEIVDKDK